MVPNVGVRTVVENHVDFSKAKNLIVSSAILILAVGGATFNFPGGISIGGLAVAAIAGIILNLILPDKQVE